MSRLKGSSALLVVLDWLACYIFNLLWFGEILTQLLGC